MNTQTLNTTIEPQSLIFLPKQLRDLWQNKKVKIAVSPDLITIKKAKKTEFSFSEIRSRLKGVEREIGKKDIEDAIKWARNQK